MFARNPRRGPRGVTMQFRLGSHARRAVLLATGVLGCATASVRSASISTSQASLAGPAHRRGSTSGAEVVGVEDAHRTIELPLRQLKTAHIVLPVVIGGRAPMSFILDTGASMSVITPQTRDALGYSPQAGLAVEGRGAGGTITNVKLLVLERLEIGPRTYRKHAVAVADLSHLEEKLEAPIAGILGRNFLARHKVEIDFSTGMIRLHPEGSNLEQGEMSGRRLERVPFTEFESAPLIRVQVKLNDKHTVPAVLDLGAGRSVMNWEAAKRVGVSRKSKGVKPSKEPLLGADNKPISTASYRFARLALGATTFAQPEVFLADLPVFRTLGIADGPAMVFGIDMLRDRVIIIDYAKQTVHISQPLSPTITAVR